MELLQLEYFVKVAETGNISRAARELYISQPALSAAIARLEADLGFQLFERRANRIFITEAGREYLEHVRKAFTLLQAGKEKAALAEHDRHYTVASPFGVTSHVLELFRKELPEYSAEMMICRSCQEIENLILNKKADFGISLKSARSKSMENTILMHSPWFATVSSALPSDRSYITIDELMTQPLFCSNLGETREEILRAFSIEGYHPNVIELDGRKILFDAVAKGLGMVICLAMPAFLDETAMNQIQYLQIRGLHTEGRISLLHLKEWDPPAPLERLVELTKQCYLQNECLIRETLLS